MTTSTSCGWDAAGQLPELLLHRRPHKRNRAPRRRLHEILCRKRHARHRSGQNARNPRHNSSEIFPPCHRGTARRRKLSTVEYESGTVFSVPVSVCDSSRTYVFPLSCHMLSAVTVTVCVAGSGSSDCEVYLKAAAHHRPHGGTRNKNPRGKHPRKRCHDERFHSHQRRQSARTGTDNDPRRNFRLHQDKLYHENEHGSRLTETLLHRMVCPWHRNGERAGMRQKRQNHGTGRAGADARSAEGLLPSQKLLRQVVHGLLSLPVPTLPKREFFS